MKNRLEALVAHSQNDDGKWHILVDHLVEVAHLASKFAMKFRPDESSTLAEWLGWWHDAGKVHPDFQTYLAQTTAAKGPDHSSVGMLHAMEMCELLAFLIAGHHGGLQDKEKLADRVKRKMKEPRICEALEMARAVFPPEIRDRRPVLPFIDRNNPLPETQRRVAFYLRMLHSALVDADCLDTERHFDSDRSVQRDDRPSLGSLFPSLEVEVRHKQGDPPYSHVNQVRREVYESCLRSARQNPGFFRLTVPTGGGKTLSGMAFALRHAEEYGMERVIVVLPYTSIIEQNAKVYRDLFGEDAVLEHQSAVTSGEPEGGNEPDESLKELRQRLAAENWDAPVIVTTGVQFYESLFASRNRRIRKLHRIARSVIILDEVQTLPVHLLEPTLEALRFLVEDYGVSVVLSSATQPALHSATRFDGIDNAREIVPNYEEHFERLRRVVYHLPQPNEEWNLEELALRCDSHEQVLVVMNTIRDALALTDAVAENDTFHLSTNLCGAHRRDVLAEIRRRLETGEPCRVVSTQVVEAGVDLDFPVVYRAVGPLDRIVQAAGRCNREGNRDSGDVYVFRLRDGGMPPGSYKAASAATEWVWDGDSSARIDDPAIIDRYFRYFFGIEDKDKEKIRDLAQELRFAEIGRRYRLIDEEAIPVVMERYAPEPIGALLDELRQRWTFAELIDYRTLRDLQPYTVNVRPHTLWHMEELGAVYTPLDGFDELRVWKGEYDKRTGLVLRGWRAGDLVI
ncbi:MAG: CRISPR-associated helicase Cas3' [Candidatus Poribacteria bacterium]|nr:CRISPR-associated helicase Cas3' [Candidatus Poribacteria bacterium]